MNGASTPTARSEKPKKQLLKQIVAIVLALALLYFAFRGANVKEVLAYAARVNLLYVILVCFTGVLGHFLRAVRWIILLKPVAGRKISVFHSFYAVIVGYAVNVAIPRGGEIARLVAINRLERLPIAGVLPTLLIDRLIDFVLLAFLVGLSLTLLPDSLLQALPNKMGWNLPTFVIRFACGIMLGAALLGLLLLPLTARIIQMVTSIGFVKKTLPPPLMLKLGELTSDFEKGASCLNSPINYPIIAILSVLMWSCYWLNYYIMLFAFNVQGQVSPRDSLIAFTIGSVGVLIPTPGSAGGVHILVQKGLELISNMPGDQALAFATIYHAAAFVVATCLPAAICWAVENFCRRRKN